MMLFKLKQTRPYRDFEGCALYACYMPVILEYGKTKILNQPEYLEMNWKK